MNYYANTAVKERIHDYCRGGPDDVRPVTARYLVGYGPSSRIDAGERKEIFDCGQLDQLLACGLDCSRSMWDSQSTLVVLDVDYQNVDFPGEAFLNPSLTYAKLEPVYQCVTTTLRELGIAYMSTMTGKGYHLVWCVPDGRALSRKLQALGVPSQTLETKYARPHPPVGDSIPTEKARSFAGLALLMEHLCHLLIRQTTVSSVLPVVSTGLAVGSTLTGREAVSLDLAAHGDPLYLRDFRSPFSRYQKHVIQRGIVGDQAARAVPFIACLPRDGLPLRDLLSIRMDPDAAAELARTASTQIPDGSRGTARLLRQYEGSLLAAFHQGFSQCVQEPPDRWTESYDRLNLDALPHCVAAPLANPNDWLLKPTYVQAVVRVLWALGWEPGHIAGLVRSRYERGSDWGDTWDQYDAATRASFWVRLMAGLIVDGTDQLADFNCVSQNEKGYCPQPYCGHNLATYREMLVRRLG